MATVSVSKSSLVIDAGTAIQAAVASNAPGAITINVPSGSYIIVTAVEIAGGGRTGFFNFGAFVNSVAVATGLTVLTTPLYIGPNSSFTLTAPAQVGACTITFSYVRFSNS